MNISVATVLCLVMYALSPVKGQKGYTYNRPQNPLQPSSSFQGAQQPGNRPTLSDTSAQNPQQPEYRPSQGNNQQSQQPGYRPPQSDTPYGPETQSQGQPRPQQPGYPTQTRPDTQNQRPDYRPPQSDTPYGPDTSSQNQRPQQPGYGTSQNGAQYGTDTSYQNQQPGYRPSQSDTPYGSNSVSQNQRPQQPGYRPPQSDTPFGTDISSQNQQGGYRPTTSASQSPFQGTSPLPNGSGYQQPSGFPGSTQSDTQFTTPQPFTGYPSNKPSQQFTYGPPQTSQTQQPGQSPQFDSYPSGPENQLDTTGDGDYQGAPQPGPQQDFPLRPVGLNFGQSGGQTTTSFMGTQSSGSFSVKPGQKPIGAFGKPTPFGIARPETDLSLSFGKPGRPGGQGTGTTPSGTGVSTLGQGGSGGQPTGSTVTPGSSTQSGGSPSTLGGLRPSGPSQIIGGITGSPSPFQPSRPSQPTGVQPGGAPGPFGGNTGVPAPFQPSQPSRPDTGSTGFGGISQSGGQPGGLPPTSGGNTGAPSPFQPTQPGGGSTGTGGQPTGETTSFGGVNGRPSPFQPSQPSGVFPGVQPGQTSGVTGGRPGSSEVPAGQTSTGIYRPDQTGGQTFPTSVPQTGPSGPSPVRPPQTGTGSSGRPSTFGPGQPGGQGGRPSGQTFRPGGAGQEVVPQPEPSTDDGSWSGDYSAIPGEPDIDYPVYSEIPRTSFRCQDQRYPGYYADVEARCQVFHVCANNRTFDFLCPNGTIFHQQFFVCVWWNQFDCNSAPGLYELNRDIYDYSIKGSQQPAKPTNQFDEQPAFILPQGSTGTFPSAGSGSGIISPSGLGIPQGISNIPATAGQIFNQQIPQGLNQNGLPGQPIPVGPGSVQPGQSQQNYPNNYNQGGVTSPPSSGTTFGTSQPGYPSQQGSTAQPGNVPSFSQQDTYPNQGITFQPGAASTSGQSQQGSYQGGPGSLSPGTATSTAPFSTGSYQGSSQADTGISTNQPGAPTFPSNSYLTQEQPGQQFGFQNRPSSDEYQEGGQTTKPSREYLPPYKR